MISYDRFACLAVVSTLAGGLAGCMSGADASLESDVLALVTQKKPGVVELKPQGVYIAEVTASGTGCPAGTWYSSISPDGQVFTTTFSTYEISVNSEVQNATRDCGIVMKLKSDQPREFAVLSVSYSGYAFLEEGITGRQTVRYGFQGASADAGNSRTEFAGPEDRDFVITDNVGADKQKWSACGPDHELTASTELRLQGKGTNASGYINVFAADGQVPTAAETPKLQLKLGWRTCVQKGGGNNGGGNNGKGNTKA
ncbi:MAG: DUF4360 domain-containing protein [Polyangiales bacterium]